MTAADIAAMQVGDEVSVRARLCARRDLKDCALPCFDGTHVRIEIGDANYLFKIDAPLGAVTPLASPTQRAASA